MGQYAILSLSQRYSVNEFFVHGNQVLNQHVTSHVVTYCIFLSYQEACKSWRIKYLSLTLQTLVQVK